MQQVEIKPGSKYSVVGSGPELRLTIYNLSKEDEGIYFCRSENPLAVRELEVYLTVKGVCLCVLQIYCIIMRFTLTLEIKHVLIGYSSFHHWFEIPNSLFFDASINTCSPMFFDY